jgi:hypothetical protein
MAGDRWVAKCAEVTVTASRTPSLSRCRQARCTGATQVAAGTKQVCAPRSAHPVGRVCGAQALPNGVCQHLSAQKAVWAFVSDLQSSSMLQMFRRCCGSRRTAGNTAQGPWRKHADSASKRLMQQHPGSVPGRGDGWEQWQHNVIIVRAGAARDHKGDRLVSRYFCTAADVAVGPDSQQAGQACRWLWEQGEGEERLGVLSCWRACQAS